MRTLQFAQYLLSCSIRLPSLSLSGTSEAGITHPQIQRLSRRCRDYWELLVIWPGCAFVRPSHEMHQLDASPQASPQLHGITTLYELDPRRDIKSPATSFAWFTKQSLSYPLACMYRKGSLKQKLTILLRSLICKVNTFHKTPHSIAVNYI